MQPAFFEEQRMRQWWLWAIVLLIAALAWTHFVGQVVLGRPMGNRPAPDWLVWGLFGFAGILLPAFFLGTRLVTRVDAEGLHLHFRYLGKRHLPFDAIGSVEALTYRPILQYGGWGIRWAPGRGWVWNAHGNRGIRLRLADGKTLLVGSQEPERLAAALEAGGVERPATREVTT